MKEPVFHGLCTELVTPFDKDGNVSISVLEQLIERQVRAGAAAIVVCGPTGEAAALTPEERIAMVRHAVSFARGRCRIIAGTGSEGATDAIELSVTAQECGADALLAATPDDSNSTEAGLLAHCEAIAEAVSLPIIVSNDPSRTGMTLTPETCLALSRIGAVNGIKEISGDLARVSRIRNLCLDELNVYSGSDRLAVPMMSVGAKGLFSVTANLTPGKFARMLRACEKGDYYKAGDMQNGLMPLIDVMFCEVNPLPLKAALTLSGYDVGPCRAPLPALSEAHRQVLARLLPKIHIE